MKVLLLCQNLGVGGAEELVLGTSTQLKADGVETEVVAITRRGLIAEEIAATDVPVYLAAGQPGPRDPVAFSRLVRLLRDRRPEVVQTYLLNACLYGRLAAIMAGVPLVLASEQNVYRDKRRRHVQLERLLAAGTFRIVACCRAVAAFYRRQVGVRPNKLAVNYNAVRIGPAPAVDQASARTTLGLPPDAMVIGTVGRLTEQKDQRMLIDAMAQLAPRFPKLVLIIAGAGELRARLQARAERLAIADRVRFLGVRRDRDTLYAAMDVFALPSRWEGLSLALIEAMGAGRPAVATRVGGNPEVVDHGRTGLLVQPGEPMALADALGSILVDAGLREALGSSARREARERFSIERHVAELTALYRRGLSERGSGGQRWLGAGP